jgi:hypothetical protein
MSHPTDNYELYQCPQDFQDRLTAIGGLNKYDQPNFIVRWAQGGEDECYYRAGGAWEVEGQPSFKGYRDLLIGGGTPSWMLLQWQPPEHWGSPEAYYVMNYDQDTGLQDLGEYPYTGRYVLLYNMRWTERIGNKLVFEAMPLNSFLLETIVPIIMQAKDISWEKTKAVLKDQQEKDDKADVAMIEDVMRDSKVPFGGNAVSYQKQGCRTSLIDKKVEMMQRNWNKIMQNTSKLGRGLSSYSANPTV